MRSTSVPGEEEDLERPPCFGFFVASRGFVLVFIEIGVMGIPVS
jgi:hypothetical protein